MSYPTITSFGRRRSSKRKGNSNDLIVPNPQDIVVKLAGQHPMWLAQSVNSSSLSGFYKFLQFHYIKISDVWKPRAVESTQEKFWAMIRDIGYNLNDAEMNGLLTLLGSNDGKICLRKLTLLPGWSKCEQEVMGIIDKSTLKLVNLSKLAMKHQ